MTSPTTARHTTWQSTRCGHSSPALSVQLRATENAHSHHPEAAPQASPIPSTSSVPGTHTRAHTRGLPHTGPHVHIHAHMGSHVHAGSCMRTQVHRPHTYTQEHTRKDHMHIGSHVCMQIICEHTQGITSAHRITHMTTCTQDHTRLAEYTHVHKTMRAEVTGVHTASHVCRHAHKVMHMPSREHVSTHTRTHMYTSSCVHTGSHMYTHTQGPRCAHTIAPARQL